MSAPPSEAPATVELGDGFIYVRRPDGRAAILAPHLQSAAVAGMMTPASLNARDASELREWLSSWGLEPSMPLAQVDQVHGTSVIEVGSPAGAAGTLGQGRRYVVGFCRGDPGGQGGGLRTGLASRRRLAAICGRPRRLARRRRWDHRQGGPCAARPRDRMSAP